MTTNDKLETWVIEALQTLGGTGSVTDIAKVIWEKHENDLRDAGDLFFTWQYSMRWAGQSLQKSGALKKEHRAWRLL